MEKEFIKRIISSSILLPLLIYLVVIGNYQFLFLIIICFLISLYEWQKMKLNNYIKIPGIIFLIFSFYTMLNIRNTFENDYWPFLIISFICISTDIGGYIFGKILKGPKLTKYSPNKTYAGMLGSYFLCILFSIVSINLNLVKEHHVFNFLIFIFLISSVSQIGDIIISYFKRISKIKDTGNIIPGHGGLLDRIDGMIFAFPFSYIVLFNEYFSSII